MKSQEEQTEERMKDKLQGVKWEPLTLEMNGETRHDAGRVWACPKCDHLFEPSEVKMIERDMPVAQCPKCSMSQMMPLHITPVYRQVRDRPWTRTVKMAYEAEVWRLQRKGVKARLGERGKMVVVEVVK